MVSMLFVTLFILSTTAGQLHLSSFFSSLKTSWWRSKMKSRLKTCPGCWSWGHFVVLLYDVTVSILFFTAILSILSVVNASERNLFQWKFGSRVLTCSLQHWISQQSSECGMQHLIDRTLFGLDAKILLPYLWEQYNYNALNIDIHLYVICIFIISIPMHRGVRVFTLEIEQVQRSNASTERPVSSWRTVRQSLDGPQPWSKLKSWLSCQIPSLIASPPIIFLCWWQLHYRILRDHLISVYLSIYEANRSDRKLFNCVEREINSVCLCDPRLSYLQGLKIALESLASWQIWGSAWFFLNLPWNFQASQGELQELCEIWLLYTVHHIIFPFTVLYSCDSSRLMATSGHKNTGRQVTCFWWELSP